MSWYDVLGVAPTASASEIREAYRALARRHHPDQQSSAAGAAGGEEMARINEAYRVLGDPARRNDYDRSLRAGSSTTQPESNRASRTRTDGVAEPRPMLPPLRMPWRTIGVAAAIGVIGVVALSQFVDPRSDPAPDGIIRIGDCVEMLDNADAAEINCTGTPTDLVVEAFVPFDGTCPGGTEPHRDRQGMGIACVGVSVGSEVGDTDPSVGSPPSS